MQKFNQKYEVYIFGYLKGGTKSTDRKLKLKIDMFIVTKNIFNLKEDENKK